jgi:hypothetical protein
LSGQTIKESKGVNLKERLKKIWKVTKESLLNFLEGFLKNIDD